MSADAAALRTDQADVPDDVDVERLARRRIERQLRCLDRLADIGMNLAETVDRELTAPRSEDQPPRNLAELSVTLERASRCVRTAFLVQSRLLSDLRRLGAGGASEPLQVEILTGLGSPELDPGIQAARRASDVRTTVRRVALAGGRSAQDAERLVGLAVDRLEVDDIDADIPAGPLSEWLADLFREFGLTPDSSDLADEPWVRVEIAGGEPGAPLKPILARKAGEPPRQETPAASPAHGLSPPVPRPRDFGPAPP